MNDFAFHHVGIVTPDIAACGALYAALGYSLSETFHDPIQKAAIVLARRPTRAPREGIDAHLADPMIELIAPEDPSSPSAGWLRRIRAGAYHTCYEVPDLAPAIEELRELDFAALTKPAPAIAFDGRRVVFLFSALTGLVELVESR